MAPNAVIYCFIVYAVVRDGFVLVHVTRGEDLIFRTNYSYYLFRRLSANKWRGPVRLGGLTIHRTQLWQSIPTKLAGLPPKQKDTYAHSYSIYMAELHARGRLFCALYSFPYAQTHAKKGSCEIIIAQKCIRVNSAFPSRMPSWNASRNLPVKCFDISTPSASKDFLCAENVRDQPLLPIFWSRSVRTQAGHYDVHSSRSRTCYVRKLDWRLR